MTFLLATTILSGVIANWVLFLLGFRDMLVRYPLSVTLSYLVFLGLVWIWLNAVLSRRVREANQADYEAGVEFADFPSASSSPLESGFAGQGGSFGGGGASSSWGDGAESQLKHSSAGDSLDLDVGEGVVVVAVVAVAVSILGSAVYLVIEAPNLLSEALFQAGLALGIFKSARGMMGDHWLEGVLKKTLVPFFLVLVFSAALGWWVKVNCRPEVLRLSDALSSCSD